MYTLCSICAGLSLYDVQDPLRAIFHGMSVGDFSGYVCSFHFLDGDTWGSLVRKNSCPLKMD